VEQFCNLSTEIRKLNWQERVKIPNWQRADHDVELLSLGPSNTIHTVAWTRIRDSNRIALTIGQLFSKVTSVLIFSFVTGSYLDKPGYTVTKPGHGGGAIQFVARNGSIVIGI